MNKSRKNFVSFSKFGLKITVEANVEQVEYLDMYLSLNGETCSLYMKPNAKIRYVNSKSNHPQRVLKNISQGVSTRLNTISSNSTIFTDNIIKYENALKKSGHSNSLVFDINIRQTQLQISASKKIQRYKKVCWFNP